jgi:hypothetical protein
MLNGGFVDLGHKFFRVFGISKLRLLLAFTIVGYNLHCISSFLTRTASKDVPTTAVRRRSGPADDVGQRRWQPRDHTTRPSSCELLRI